MPPGDSSLPSYCAERAELGSRLATAIAYVYRLRADSQAAKLESDKRAALFNLLQEARTDQRRAEHALSNHIKEHGCAE
jgi:hypothetical protein